MFRDLPADRTPKKSDWLKVSQVWKRVLEERIELAIRMRDQLNLCIGYGISFYCLALTLRVIPMGVVYAIWSGIGIVLITVVGWLLFEQKLDLPALLGIALIAAGVVVMNVFSKTMGH